MWKRTKAPALGAISRIEVYPLAVFCRRTGLGRHSLTAARREGLPVVAYGRRLYVRGSDAVDFFAKLKPVSGLTEASRPGKL